MASKPASSVRPYSSSTVEVPAQSGDDLRATTQPPDAFSLPPPPLVATGDLLRVLVSGDAAGGPRTGGPHAKLQVSIDGQALGDPLEVTADHAAGQWQVLELMLPDGMSRIGEIGIRFVNDWAGNGLDRNLYVDEIRLGNALLDAEEGRLVALDGAVLPGRQDLDGFHTLTFDVGGHVGALNDQAQPPGTVPMPPVVTGDLLHLVVSGDAAGGAMNDGPNARFEVLVNGRLIDEVWEASANHGAGEWQTIDVRLGTELALIDTISVRYVNDWARGRGETGGHGEDRNLYVREVGLDDLVLTADQAVFHAAGGASKPGAEGLWRNGMLTFDVETLVHQEVQPA